MKGYSRYDFRPKTVEIIKTFGQVQELGKLYDKDGKPILIPDEEIITESKGNLYYGREPDWIGFYFLTNIRFIFIGNSSDPSGAGYFPGWKSTFEHFEEKKYHKSLHIRQYAGFEHNDIIGIKKTMLGNYRFDANLDGNHWRFQCTFKKKDFKNIFMEFYANKLT